MPYHQFGIIENFDKNNDYGYYTPAAYNTVDINDELTDNWYKRLTMMKSYFHCYNRPATALAFCGVTLIPPESLDLFYDIVAVDTKKENLTFEQAENLSELLNMILKAKKHNKFMIHFGI